MVGSTCGSGSPRDSFHSWKRGFLSGIEARLPARGLHGGAKKPSGIASSLFTIDITPECVVWPTVPKGSNRVKPGAIIMPRTIHTMKRREFLKSGLKAAGGAAGLSAGLGAQAQAQSRPAAGPSIALVLDPADQTAFAPPSKWAATELLSRLQARKINVRIVASVRHALPQEICVMASGPQLTPPAIMPMASRPPAAAESFTISSATISG